jgi:predicted neuraminidase
MPKASATLPSEPTPAEIAAAMDGIVRPAAFDPDRRQAYLPSPVVQNHAANLIELANGDLGCVWFGGTMEGMGDISVYFSRLDRSRDVWSPPAKLSDDTTRSEQNPVLFYAPDGRLWLVFTSQPAGNQDAAIVKYRVSDDDGQSFGPVGVLWDAPGTFVRQPPLIAGDRWVLPLFLCHSLPGQRWRGDDDRSALLVSTDAGRTWQCRDVPGSTGCVHMNVLPATDGFVALYRSRYADTVKLSRSADGLDWSAPIDTALPNNNSSVQGRRLADGRLVIAYNENSALTSAERRASLYDEIEGGGSAQSSHPIPSEPHGEPVEPRGGLAAGAALFLRQAQDEDDLKGSRPAATAAQAGIAARPAIWGVSRAPLMLALSADDGKTFPLRRRVQGGSGYCLSNNSRDGLNREYSYPSVLQSRDGQLHLAFTAYRRAIQYVRVTPGWIGGIA